MSWHNVKILPADKVFSVYTRKRDGKCLRCAKRGTGADGIHGLQACHYYSRRKWSVRYDEQNVDTLCIACHQWSHRNPAAYEEWKIQQLGQQGFDLLTLRANSPGKRDDAMALIAAKALLSSLDRAN
jgi:hypothetical protein